MFCSISIKQSSPPAGQTGRTSTDILCQEASKSLCPSRRVDIPAFPLQGSSLRNGVRFSVQTTSWGRVPWSRYRLDRVAFG